MSPPQGRYHANAQHRWRDSKALNASCVCVCGCVCGCVCVRARAVVVIQVPAARCGHSGTAIPSSLVATVTGARNAHAAMVVFGGDDGSGHNCNDVSVAHVEPGMSVGAARGASRWRWRWHKWRVGGDRMPAGRALHTACIAGDRYGSSMPACVLAPASDLTH